MTKNLEITKERLDLAWKVYNYVNIYEDKIFGSKKPNNASYMFILTLIALYGEMNMQHIIHHTGVGFKDIYKYIEGLQGYYRLIAHTADMYHISSTFLRSIKSCKIKINPVNEDVFCTVLSNMRYHTNIFQENLQLEENSSKFKLMRAMLNPVISNPIHAKDCRKLSTLGYMKYQPQKKELKLNEIAYKKDWVGTSVI